MNADSSRNFFRAAAGAAEIESRAADWIALRETRALTPAEAAAFAAWRAADLRHEAAVAELGAAGGALDGLRDYPRPAAAPADPEFFSCPRRASWLRPAVLSAAAAVALGSVLWFAARPARENAAALAVASTTLGLDDGSEVELRPGSEVVPQFTAAERRVRLVRGEAYFTVAKNSARPFVVEAGGVAVRAVGTAFNVRLDSDTDAELVTEGVVRIGTPEAVRVAESPAAVLTAGQRTLVAESSLAAATPPPAVETLAPAEIDRALAWQTGRLVFEATPLAEVAARFERHTGRRLVLADAALASLPVSGRFRAANLDSFLELLERGFGVAVERRATEIVLRRAEKLP